MLKKQFTYFLSFILLSGFQLKAQDTLNNINWQVENGNVFIEWFLEKGQTCLGIDVNRRSDTLTDFQTIHNIPGLCGSEDKRIRFTYTDTSAKHNSFNYYMIDLGGEAQLFTTGVYVLVDQDVLVYPQPSNGQTVNIRFRNAQSQTFIFELYHTSGQKVMSLETKEDGIQLQNTFDAGVYLFRLVGDGQEVVGRVVF